ncbi:hypothetical protein P4555_22155, partial [Peribacillus frigoritolerans]|uniref:hypothetical protein n=1 Tax=Peribacillus frigoritolerans TaxID=450367 RepID=UPI002E1E1F61|nr:hypothetical protein [Peribacillus frigoritolerans]
LQSTLNRFVLKTTIFTKRALRNIVGKLPLFLQFVYSLAVPSIFRQKEFRIALASNQNFKSKLDYPSVFLKGLKKNATLLPNNWLAKTLQVLL